MINITPLTAGDPARCVAILHALPQWFGIESAIVEYGEHLEALDGYAAVDDDGTMVGFVGLQRYGTRAVEIEVIGVYPDRRGKGVGRRLVEQVVTDLPPEVRLLHMKTLAPSDPDPNYAETRAFWEATGFIPMDAHELWGPENPCLVMTRPIQR